MMASSIRRVAAHQQTRKSVTVIAITGGPCGGKTSALVELAASLPALGGAEVMTTPEFSTLFFAGGCPYPAGGSREQQVAWDLNKLKAQMAFEDAFRAVAESKRASDCTDSGTPIVLLMDRGVMDTKAFVSEEAWEEMLDVHGWDEEQFLRRYDSVIHLVSTAIGAEDHYSGENNEARRETIEEARRQDLAVRDAWLGHANFRIISNRCDGFEAKLRKVKESVCEVAGLPMPVAGGTKKRWLVRNNGIADADGVENLVVHHVETDFIAASGSADEDICVRRRRRLNCSTDESRSGNWLYSIHERLEDGSTRSRPLARRDYEAWRSRREEENPMLSMTRTSFIFEENFWKLDEFHGRDTSRLTLEAGSFVAEPLPPLPPFFSFLDRVGNLSLREMRDTVLKLP